MSPVDARPRAAAPAAVIDVGGSGIAIWALSDGGVEPILRWQGRATPREVGALARAAVPRGAATLVATPGMMDARGLVHASNLAWSRVDLGEAIAMPGHDVRWVNDAAAIAAGEHALHRLPGRTLVLTFGTGLGVAVADDRGATTLMVSADRECAHMDTGLDLPCACGRTGCAEAVARRWLDDNTGGEALKTAVRRMLVLAGAGNLVLCGGALRRGDNQRRAVALLDDGDAVRVVTSAAGAHKSAAPHGALTLWQRARCLA